MKFTAFLFALAGVSCILTGMSSVSSPTGAVIGAGSVGVGGILVLTLGLGFFTLAMVVLPRHTHKA
jgi:hypothetical protein